eukprot:CAMPEP_0177682698 /NCGR_PEP_ID=MMETSP0447-20121125/31393_1 /TAXON_ID=0 /ORGANISM="Stygamoeba regulata, Strain BSH-02190019" /LENGTH=423 /DNA_ID=CAMNT_0019192209 /DNA_START=33 /DNA_END=1304 /DNA_ORIENTATION=+
MPTTETSALSAGTPYTYAASFAYKPSLPQTVPPSSRLEKASPASSSTGDLSTSTSASVTASTSVPDTHHSMSSSTSTQQYPLERSKSKKQLRKEARDEAKATRSVRKSQQRTEVPYGERRATFGGSVASMGELALLSQESNGSHGSDQVDALISPRRSPASQDTISRQQRDRARPPSTATSNSTSAAISTSTPTHPSDASSSSTSTISTSTPTQPSDASHPAPPPSVRTPPLAPPASLRTPAHAVVTSPPPGLRTHYMRNPSKDLEQSTNVPRRKSTLDPSVVKDWGTAPAPPPGTAPYHPGCPKSVLILRQGWLTKKGKVRRNWLKRWFCLTDQLQLCYFRSPDDARQLGSIPVKSITRLSQFAEDLRGVDLQGSTEPFSFQLETEGRTYFLISSTHEDGQRWCQLIQEQMQRSRNTHAGYY